MCMSCLEKIIIITIRLLAHAEITHSLKCNRVKCSLKRIEKYIFHCNPFFRFFKSSFYFFSFFLFFAAFFFAVQCFLDLDFEIINCMPKNEI